MSTEWLLEATLLLAGVLCGAAAVNRLRAGERGLGLRLGVASLGLITLAVVFTTSDRMHPAWWRRDQETKPLKPAAHDTAARADSAMGDPDSTRATSLWLGDVLLRVVPSERYRFTMEDEEFLTLQWDSSGLMVSCEAADSTDERVITVSKNSFERFQYRARHRIQASMPDSSTLLVKETGEEVLRIRYAAPGAVEISGRFYLPESPGSFLVTRASGVRWKGGYVPPGSTIDLTQQGKGSINFEGSGLIQIRPE